MKEEGKSQWQTVEGLFIVYGMHQQNIPTQQVRRFLD